MNMNQQAWLDKEDVADLDDHHRDPFDRLIVAQSLLEDMTVATADPVFSRYTQNLIGP